MHTHLVVRTGLRLLAHKLRQVSTVDAQLAVFVVDDVGANEVQEARVMRHHNGGHVGEGHQVVLRVNIGMSDCQ